MSISGNHAVRGRRLSRAFAVLVLAVSATVLFGTTATATAAGTVKISGNAYAFFGIDNTMPGAVVKIEEYPELEAAVQPDGFYEIEVPDGVNVTPYIIPADTYDPGIIDSLTPPPPYERVYNQTFRTSGEDLRHVHFQIPSNLIYKAFIGLLGAETTGEPGEERLKNCAVVSTFSMKEARAATEFRPPSPEPPGYPDTFRDVYPHGVPGSTAAFGLETPGVDGPVFFSFPGIVPDRGLTASTEDGGVLWTEVPPGYHWMQAENPDPAIEFAPFMAKCEPGRLVNASPPWGFYELEEGAEPNPAVFAEVPSEVDPEARLSKPAVKGPRKIRRGKRVSYRVVVRNTGDATATGVKIRVRGQGRSFSARIGNVPAGKARATRVKIKLRKRGKAKLVFRVRSDNAGGSKRSRKIRVVR